MKTIHQSIVCLAALSTLLFTISCTTSQPVAYSSTAVTQPVPFEVHWYLVSEDPPSYFPMGLDKDADTDFRHGDWVRAGDGGAMWFIPSGGAGGRSAEQLREEAFSMTTRAQELDLALDAAGDFIEAPLRTAAAAYVFLAGGEGAEQVLASRNDK